MSVHGKALKKPVEIDWFEWQLNPDDLVKWIESFKDSFIFNFRFNGVTLRVRTLEGTSYAVPEGYIIIRGIKGEYYPCEPVIFKDTHKVI